MYVYWYLVILSIVCCVSYINILFSPKSNNQISRHGQVMILRLHNVIISEFHDD